MVARLTSVLPWWAWVFGLVVGLFAFVNLADDVRQTTGWPVEHATVVSSSETPEPDGHDCGAKRRRMSRDVVWRSDDPPSGLPAVFTVTNACHGVRDLGLRVRVVRVVEDDGGVHVYVDPEDSYADAAWLGLLVTGMAWLVMAIWRWSTRLRD